MSVDLSLLGTSAEWAVALGPIHRALYGTVDPVRVELALRQQVGATVESCMNSRGFGYTAESFTTSAVRADLYLNGLGTPLADPATRSDYAYGLTVAGAASHSPERVTANSARYAGLTAQEQAAWDESLTMCDQQAGDQLGLVGTDWNELNRMVATANGQADRTLLSDAQASYADCMKSQGLDFPSTEAVAAHFLAVSSSPTADAAALYDEARAAAITDWHCQETNTTPAWIAYRDQIENSVLEAAPDLVARLRAIVDSVAALGDTPVG